MSADSHHIKFTKVLSANDLGLTGTHQSGVLLPKALAMHSFLPELNYETINPRATVEFWCPALSSTIEVQYIYYNAKTLGTGTRNEFRLTRLAPLFHVAKPRVGQLLEFSFEIEIQDSVKVLANRPTVISRVLRIEDSAVSQKNRAVWNIVEVPFG